MQAEPPQSSRSGAFSGRGRTLAGDAPAEEEAPAAQAPAQAPEQMVHTITFFQNGVFTVDDGERAAFHSASFFSHVQKGCTSV